MSFKNQAEIYQALLDEKKITFCSWVSGRYVCLVNGFAVDRDGNSYTFSFDHPEEWSIYTEPKPKKTIEFFECVAWSKEGAIIHWLSETQILSFREDGFNVTKTGQSRIIEVEE